MNLGQKGWRQGLAGVAMVVLGMGAVMSWYGCSGDEDDRSKKPRMASRPVEATGPGTQQNEVVVAPNAPEIPPDLKPIPDPGQAIATTMPDGQLWQKYANGLAFQEIRPGTAGAKIAQAGQTVRLKYVGTLPNGAEFDRSDDAGISFQLGTKKIIPGWNIVVHGMRLGNKRKVWIPADLAYGANGRGKIGPNQDLVFEMELLEISGTPVRFPEAPATLPTLQREGPTLPSTVPATSAVK